MVRYFTETTSVPRGTNKIHSFGVFIISQVPSSSTNDLGKGYPVNEWLCYLSAHSFTLVLRYLSLLFLWMVDQVRAVSTGYK